MSTHKPSVLSLLVALASAPWGSAALAQQASTIDEIVVTARQRAETLQDVPVTVVAFSNRDLERYNIRDLVEMSELVPNFEIFQGTSGNGSNLYMRGVGSSSISAAFDQSVALNIDGVVANRGRLIFNAYLDMEQIEVLKGPQSLYFGKSASAGVVSVTTKNPSDEFEVQAMAGYEFEHDQRLAEFIISGPLSDNFGARFALGRAENNKLFENIHPDATVRWRGEESTDARLTLVWTPNERFDANLKVSYSDFESDGSNGRHETLCADDTVQPTAIFGGTVIRPNFDDCKLNGNTSIADLDPALAAQMPHANDGVPFLEQEIWLTSLALNYDVTDQIRLTAITGYVDLDHLDMDIYDHSSGVFGGAHENRYRSISQELRMTTSFNGPLNLQAGIFYQDIEQEFFAFQYAVNIGLVGPDPVTGNTHDYQRNHFTDTEVYSGFLALYYDVTETVQVTAGARYTDEKKKGRIEIPYVHYLLPQPPFLSSGARIDGLTVDDSNFSPEVSISWRVRDNINLFAVYKEGFKSGGIDNAALPSNSLQPTNPDFPDFLIFGAEEAKGFEVGVKSHLLQNSMRLNATAFRYLYSDLQINQFDSTIIQHETFNASELRTQGIEAELDWLTPVDGLSIRSALAYTDTEYTDTFINIFGQDLRGEPLPTNSKWAGNFGVTYDWRVGGIWRASLSADARYASSYKLQNELNADKQGSFWVADAAVTLYTEDERYEIAFIGRNVTDKIYARIAGPRPGALIGPSGRPDQSVNTSLGAQYTLRARVRF